MCISYSSDKSLKRKKKKKGKEKDYKEPRIHCLANYETILKQVPFSKPDYRMKYENRG